MVNTIAQYTKTIINVLLSLYSTRLVLQVLGTEDYGIYSIVGGVVTMLSFITNSLITTTQRFLSFFQGQGDLRQQKLVFSNSVLLHLFLGLVIIFFLYLIGLFLFDNFLSIPKERVIAAYNVYNIISLTIFITFITSPFKALLVSHENIIYVSIIDVIDGGLKLFIAIVLCFISYDKLISYAWLLSVVSLFNFVAFVWYSFRNFKECTIPKLSEFNIKYVKDLFSFAFWNIYSTGCIVGRTQGIAVLINRFYGPLVNAAYGVAFTVSSAVQFVSSSLCNAMNPQIMKAEGQGNRLKMIRLAEIESKFGFLLIALVGIPCVFNMDVLLSIWLKDVPQYSVYFSQMVMLSAIIDQLTIGLVAANQAVGNIRMYSLVINSIKLFTLPVSFLFLYTGFEVESVMICYLIFELICAVARIFFLQKTAGLNYLGFLEKVFLKELIPILILIVTCFLVYIYIEIPYIKVLLMFFLSSIIYIISIYFFALCDDEKIIINNVLQKIITLCCK